jgi:hypothetical protein
MAVAVAVAVAGLVSWSRTVAGSVGAVVVVVGLAGGAGDDGLMVCGGHSQQEACHYGNTKKRQKVAMKEPTRLCNLELWATLYKAQQQRVYLHVQRRHDAGSWLKAVYMWQQQAGHSMPCII